MLFQRALKCITAGNSIFFRENAAFLCNYFHGVRYNHFPAWCNKYKVTNNFFFFFF